MRVTVGAGRLRIEVLHGTGSGAQSVAIRPPVQREWLIYEAEVFHDDGADRQIVLQRTDGTTTFTLGQDATLSSGAHALIIPTNEPSADFAPTLQGPIRVTRDCYLILYSGTAWTDGTKLDIHLTIDDIGSANA